LVIGNQRGGQSPLVNRLRKSVRYILTGVEVLLHDLYSGVMGKIISITPPLSLPLVTLKLVKLLKVSQIPFFLPLLVHLGNRIVKALIQT
jgi:hypothetical protein